MKLSAGDKLGPYEIAGPIGRGGMGEVFRGTDTRLGRPVAIKISNRDFNDRFEREARAISALNHPNICTLYDVGPNYLVMEFVEGDLLSSLIDRGALPLDKALAYAIQIADALAAAHQRGIIHRDLKPGNIIVTRNGVKVLDFGLARLTPLANAAIAASMPTLHEPITGVGTIIGTLYYMAPEQVEGREADERSDIFSFGAVLYEMITGQRAFTGDSQASVMAAVLKDQLPSMNLHQTLTPRTLERVVRQCVEKKPDDRWNSARDLKRALELIDVEAQPVSSTSSIQSAQVAKPTRARRWLAPALALVIVALAGAAGWLLRPKPAPPRSVRFQLTLPDNVQFSQYVSVSPDGRKLLVNATGSQSGLWVHDLNTLEWHRLSGSENAVGPFWSPDSRFLGFAVSSELKKIDISGGPPQTLCTVPFPAGTGAWNRDGVIVFGGRGRGELWKVSSSGGVPAQVTTTDASRGETFHALASFLPDGKHFLYLRGGPPQIAGIYLGSLDAKPAEQSKARLIADSFAASFIDGNVFFMREGTLMMQPFNAGKLQMTGEPSPVAEHVATTGSTGIFSISPAGVMAYVTGIAAAPGFQTSWFNREGKSIGTFGSISPDRGLTLSPDATAAVGRDAPQDSNGDIWLLAFTRDVRTRLTFRQSAGSFPVWSPDGAKIAFAAGTLLDTIYEKPANGAGQETALYRKLAEIKIPTSWSHDGRFLLFYTVGVPQTGQDLWVLSTADHKASQLLATEFLESQGSFSPDGRWVAYLSNESGSTQVYVRPFVPSGPNGPSLGEGKWQVSRDPVEPSQRPRWRSDGKELIFATPGYQIMSVDVQATATTFQPGNPHQLFALPPVVSLDVTADGKRFLASTLPGGSQQGSKTPITVVVNWQSDLKK